MSRVMTVRNDEELRNLRKIGIVGVRYQKDCSGINLTVRTFSVIELLALVWNSLYVDYFLNLGLLLTACFSRCRVQLLRYRCLHFSDASHGRHRLPRDLIIHASSVPTRDGKFLQFYSRLFHAHVTFSSQWLSLIS